MVNGFSKCQSSCFIDSVSQREEQTHLAGILLTAGAAGLGESPPEDHVLLFFSPFLSLSDKCAKHELAPQMTG